MFIKRETILRKYPKFNSEIIDILKVNNEIDEIETILNNLEDEEYVKVRFNDIEGYIISSSLSDNKINIKNKGNSISKENKIKILLEIKKILNQNTSYSAKLNNKYYENGKTRGNGYYNIPYYEKTSGNKYFSYDCSSFCSTIINRVFGKNMARNDNGKTKIEIRDNEYYPNLWTTKDFLENALLEDSDSKKFFTIIEHAKKIEEYINISKMEIGDLIVGIIDFENEKHNKNIIMNHIMIYIGDGYIVHASYTNGQVIFNKVLKFKISNDFYIKIGFDKRFDKEIALIRYI